MEAINAKKEPESVRLLTHTYTNRPVNTLTATFSREFSAKLKNQPLHQWQALQSADGWHIVRVEAVIPRHAMTVPEVGNSLAEDWQQDNMRKSATNAVRAMAKSYVIRGAELP